MVEIIPIQTKVVVILVTRKVAETEVEVETEEVMAVVIVENQDFLRLHAGATVPPEVLRRPIRAGMTMEETEEEEDTKEAAAVEAATMIDAAVAIRAAGVAAEEEVASVVVEEEVTGMNAASKVT